MNEIASWRTQRSDEPAPVEQVYSRPSDEAHLRDYWKVVVRYHRLILIIFLTIFVFGAYIISGATPMYTAASTIKIDPQTPQVVPIAEVLKIENSDQYASTQQELIKSRALAARVIAELGLESNRTFNTMRIVSPDPIKWVNGKFFGTIQSIVDWVSGLLKSSQSKSTAPFTNAKSSSNSISNESASSLKVDNKPTVNPGTISRYLNLLRVEPMRGTRLVRIIFTTPDANLSQQLANAHATAFVKLNLETRFEVTKDARKFLEQKLQELRTRIEESEAELSEFRRAHGVVSMDRGENLIVDRMISLNTSLTAARIKRLELESLRQMIENKNPAELSEVMSNPTIQGYRGTIDSLIAEQVKLSTVFKPDHPRMVEISTRINDTRQRMKTAINEVVHRIQTDYESARNREASLDAEASRQKQAAIDLKSLGIRYTVLQGEVDANQRLYSGLLARLTETTISNDLPVSNMQVTELADSPGGLSSGGQQLKLLMSTAGLGLFLSLGLAFCLAYFDSRISTSEDVWRFLYLPTLGIVPDLKLLRYGPNGYIQFFRNPLRRLVGYIQKQAPNKDVVISAYPESIIAESYRSIRTALLFSRPESAPRTVLFTSAGPAEGKTVTTLNLAIALAQSGKTVLLIDGDLRKGRCHKLLHRPNEKGLSHLLTSNLSVEESLQSTSVQGLSLLTRGMVPPSPPDLLGSRKMKEILDGLRQRFEFILVDASPVIGVTDAEVLSTYCDAVVFVMHSQKTSRFTARQALQTLESVRADILGVVLNGIDIRSPDYASYRYYYSSYYATVEKDREARPNDSGKSDRPADVTPQHTLVWPAGKGPKQVLERMIFRLSEAVGPMAPLIVQDHVALMGESMESFPPERLSELFDKVGQEILNDDLRDRFKRNLSLEIGD